MIPDEEGQRKPAEAPEPGGTRSRGDGRTRMLVTGLLVIPVCAAIPAFASPSVPPGREVASEGFFPLSALVLGREAARRYRRCLVPRALFGSSGKG